MISDLTTITITDEHGHVEWSKLGQFIANNADAMDERDPIDDPRLTRRAFEARILVVCTIALLVTGYLTGKGWVDYERAHARIEVRETAR